MDCKTAQEKITPYIEHRLTDREAEEFIEHVRGCRECSEELEVYYTIHYALEQLDKEEQDTYNIKELLEHDLQQTENQIRRHNIMRFYRRLLMALAGILGAVLLITAAQFFLYGSLERTTLYNLFDHESESALPPAESGSVQKETEESTERETNRKRQVVVTIPETEERETESALLE